MTIKEFDEHLRTLVQQALQEDVGDGDHSTLCCIPTQQTGKAVLKIKQAGVLAGVQAAQKMFNLASAEVVFHPYKNDGE